MWDIGWNLSPDYIQTATGSFWDMVFLLIKSDDGIYAAFFWLWILIYVTPGNSEVIFGQWEETNGKNLDFLWHHHTIELTNPGMVIFADFLYEVDKKKLLIFKLHLDEISINCSTKQSILCIISYSFKLLLYHYSKLWFLFCFLKSSHIVSWQSWFMTLLLFWVIR